MEYPTCPRCGKGRMVPLLMSTACDLACERAPLRPLPMPSTAELHAAVMAQMAITAAGLGQRLASTSPPLPPPPSKFAWLGPNVRQPAPTPTPAPAPAPPPPAPNSIAPSWNWIQFLSRTCGTAPPDLRDLSYLPRQVRAILVNRTNPDRQVMVRFDHVAQRLDWRGEHHVASKFGYPQHMIRHATWLRAATRGEWFGELWEVEPAQATLEEAAWH